MLTVMVNGMELRYRLVCFKQELPVFSVAKLLETSLSYSFQVGI